MTITISGTTGIAGVDGSAGTPAVQGTDGNTGVFYPAADTVGVSTGGSERMRIDSSGNVGIGTVNPAGYKVRVVGASGTPQFRAGTDTGSYLEMNGYDSNPFYCVVAGSTVTQAVFGSQSNIPTVFFTNNTERGRFDTSGNFQFNSGYGSVATAYGCRAWVNFNGTGTVAIRASGNVSSITDNSTGDYTVNFTTAMPDANYGVSGLIGAGSSTNRVATGWFSAPSTSAFQIRCNNASFVATDTEYVSIAVFR